MLVSGWAALPLRAQATTAAESEDANVPVTLAQNHGQGLVSIEQWSKPPQRRSTVVTGFFVPPAKPNVAWVLTYLPSGEAGDTFQVGLGRNMLAAKLIAYDLSLRLALLELNTLEREGLTIAPDSPGPEALGKVIYTLDTSCLSGAPAQTGRFAGREPLTSLDPTLLRLHVKVGSGSAGSPVFNAQQKLVGLLTLPCTEAVDSYYAIPAEHLQRFLSSVRRHGKALTPWLGIVIAEPLNNARIKGCRDNSPAQRAGLEPNDLVLSVGSTKISSLQGLIDLIALLPADVAVDFTVLRGQQIKTFKITPTMR